MSDAAAELRDLAAQFDFDWQILRVEFDEEGCLLRFRDTEDDERVPQALIVQVRPEVSPELAAAFFHAFGALNDLATAALKVKRNPEDVKRARL